MNKDLCFNPHCQARHVWGKPTVRFKDKKKYTRKPKYKETYNEKC